MFTEKSADSGKNDSLKKIILTLKLLQDLLISFIQNL